MSELSVRESIDIRELLIYSKWDYKRAICLRETMSE
jgi:hypothetical protein